MFKIIFTSHSAWYNAILEYSKLLNIYLLTLLLINLSYKLYSHEKCSEEMEIYTSILCRTFYKCLSQIFRHKYKLHLVYT